MDDPFYQATDVWTTALCDIAQDDTVPVHVRVKAARALAMGTAFVAQRPESLRLCAAALDAADEVEKRHP